MRLTEAELKQIVQEEIEQAIEEGYLDRLVAKAKGFGTKTKAHAQSLGQRAGTWAREKSGAAPETVAGERAAAAATKKAGAEGARRTRALHIIKKSWDRFHDDLKAVGAYEVPEIVVARDAMMNAIEKLTPDQGAPAPEQAEDVVVTAVNSNNLATRDADNFGDDGKLNAQGLKLAKAQIAFLKKKGRAVPKLLSQHVSTAGAPDPADAETIQVAPVTDIGSASTRKKGGGDDYKAWKKRAGVREE